MAKFRKKMNYVNKGNHSLNPDRPIPAKKGKGNNMRDKNTINRLKMYKSGKPVRNRDGKIVKAAVFQGTLPSGTVARVEPNRRWFGNTRVVSQSSLQTFQEELSKAMKDPYQVVMRQTKLPISLLQEKAKHARVHLLDTETFESTFGKKKQRKKPRLMDSDMQSFLKSAERSNEKYDVEKDHDLEREDDGIRTEAKEAIFNKGTSPRIWGELHKVIDSSDVVIQVLDARDPQGTRCRHIEKLLTTEKKHKHLIFVLNKVDLVPTWVTQRWVATLSQEFPTLALHASVNNPFGKGALIQLLRQFAKLHQDKKQISVGFIGYPNVGKSSIINTLRAKKVCKVAPIAGETKVWQYITLMRRIFLIDCPGVVYPTGESETQLVLKGVVRVENIKCPEDYIPAVIDRVKEEYIQRTYGIADWTDADDFLEKLARKSGKLLKEIETKRLDSTAKGKKEDVYIKKDTRQHDSVLESDDSQKLVVTQDLSQICVEPDFLGDDMEGVLSNMTYHENTNEAEEINLSKQKEELSEAVSKDICHLSKGMQGFMSGKKTYLQKLSGLTIKPRKLQIKEKKRKHDVSVKDPSKYMKLQDESEEKKNSDEEDGEMIGRSSYQNEESNLVEDDNCEVKETNHVAMVHMPVKSMKHRKRMFGENPRQRKRKRYFEEDSDDHDKPSKKEVRREHKRKMREKIGVRFYEEVNVKNKNYRKTKKNF
ncbi:uncharacterized protein [Ptychodera flava]|uniref:uncharacterized protein isoform X2 n=1 Tax=Ptychodera flava TaxID=63121 RepID=UPI003969EDEA